MTAFFPQPFKRTSLSFLRAPCSWRYVTISKTKSPTSKLSKLADIVNFTLWKILLLFILDGSEFSRQFLIVHFYSQNIDATPATLFPWIHVYPI
jgi:hypothetical protein